MMKTISAVMGFSAFALVAAHAADAPKSGDPPELANYTHTGKFETCITNHQIDNMRVLNKKQILIEMRIGHGAYLAEAEHCPTLGRDVTLVYDATIDQFCNTTIIRLVDASAPAMQRGSCGIDRFEKLEKKK
jgi:hypothetical protein